MDPAVAAPGVSLVQVPPGMDPVHVAVDPVHKDVVPVMTGVTGSDTVTSSEAVMAHWPAVGVKVYEVVPDADVFITAGLHVPETPLVDVAGKVPGVAPTQYGPIAENAGVTSLPMVRETVMVVSLPQAFVTIH